MTYISETAIRQAQDLSWQLGSCHDTAELESRILQWLYDNVRCSHASYTDYPAYHAPTRVKIVPYDVDCVAVERSVEDHFAEQPLSDHPLVAHYFYQWRPVTPLRMSDLMSDLEFRGTRVYSQVFKPVGVTHQLALVNRRISGTDNAGYAVMRQGRDFTDDEVALAILVQPVLYAMHQAVSVPPQCDAAEATVSPRLTPSEAEVLRLLAAGMTAAAIAHARCTSTRTVNRHVQSIYDKLGMHDRLQVALYARQTGLVPAPIGPAEQPDIGQVMVHGR